MKLSPSTITATTVLLVALIGGAAGGALALGSPDEAPRPSPIVQMNPAAAESDVTAEPTAAPVEPAPVPAVEDNGTMATTPIDAPAPSAPEPAEAGDGSAKVEADRAETAADRARIDADRAKVEADRAETAADRAETAPATAPEPAPAPAPKCKEGDVVTEPNTLDRDGYGTFGAERTCRNGEWFVTKERRTTTRPPAPAPVQEPPVAQTKPPTTG